MMTMINSMKVNSFSFCMIIFYHCIHSNCNTLLHQHKRSIHSDFQEQQPIMNTTITTSSSSSSSDLFRPLNCTVDYHIQLGLKPDNQHKEDTIFKHSTQTPILSVGAYQWIELTCTCCCKYTEQWEQIIKTQLTQSINQTVVINQSSVNNNKTATTLLYKITSSNGHVIALSLSKRIHSNIHLYHCDNTTDSTTYNNHNNSLCITLYLEIKCNTTNGFYIHAENLGHSQITTSLIWINSTSRKHIESLTKLTDSLHIIDDYYHQQNRSTAATSTVTTTITSSESIKQHQIQLKEETLYQLTNKGYTITIQDPTQIKITEAKIYVPKEQVNYHDKLTDELGNSNNDSLIQDESHGIWKNYLWLTVLLRPQKFYITSDWSSAVIAFMLALSVGCCNDPIMIREQLNEPKAILTGLFYQLIIIPMMAIGFGLVFGLDIDQAFGLFICSTVPAGGLAYLMTYLSHGDRQLSAALSLIASITDLVIMPLWAITVGWYWFNRPINIGKTFGWLMLIASAQSIGTLMRGCQPGLARAILTWITRPLLLLSGILLVTLGVYINHYAFNEVTQNLIFALLSLNICGFAIGWLVGLITNQGCARSRTLSTAASVFNGLLCIPLLRTCVHAPEGDLAAVAALWTVLFTPIPLAYHAVVTIVEKWLKSYIQNRRKQREEEKNCMATLIGGKQHEFGAASVAAVAAAAIAVTPAIATRNLSKNDKNSIIQSEKTISNDNEIDSSCVEQSPLPKAMVNSETMVKMRPSTVTTPVNSNNHHCNMFTLNTIELDCENHEENARQHRFKHLYGEQLKSVDGELNLDSFANNNSNSLLDDNEKRSSGFITQQLRDKRTNWLTDFTGLKKQQQEERSNSTEIGMLTLTDPNISNQKGH
ncbi:unnamed protein product [Schistosoma rodhaini]|uniref:Uncharacterized protein n=1 Tax=Schistosoma rodhaini TaxID=6188 RepID=A0AA85GDM7_9TREM|nr:unnamed protein product [Schistosoma rodhaini]